jgi:hypothetical protein
VALGAVGHDGAKFDHVAIAAVETGKLLVQDRQVLIGIDQVVEHNPRAPTTREHQ